MPEDNKNNVNINKIPNGAGKAVQFGAGNIGRGFLGQLFSESGYEVVFVEIDKKIVDTLNKDNSYLLKIVGDNPQDITVRNVRAVDARDVARVAEEIKTARIMATAVGVNVLEKIAPVIARGIELRAEQGIEEPLNIIICENLLNAGEVLKGYIKRHCHCLGYLDSRVGFVASVVSRMIPVVPEEIKKRDPTVVMVEEYCRLPVDGKGFKGEAPRIKGVIAYDNIEAYEEQKLFIHNLSHAMFAYLGYLKGYQYIWQAVKDREINDRVRAALRESGAALIKKHKFTEKETREHTEDLLTRFSNKALGDTVCRVGREPLRKLGPEDRLMGAAQLALKYDVVPENISLGIAAALCYDYPQDEEAVKLALLLKDKGVAGTLEEISGLDPDSELCKLVADKYVTLRPKNFNNWLFSKFSSKGVTPPL